MRRFEPLQLEKMIACLDQQIIDANALLRELPVGSPDSDIACDWLAEIRETRERYL